MRTKFGIAICVLIAACSPETDMLRLESTSQEIFLPLSYGMESDGDALRCDSDWEGGTCYVADKKTLKFYVDLYSCSPWYRQRATNAVIDIEAMVSPYGWHTQLVGVDDPWTYLIYCESQDTRPAAHSWFTNNQDCHNTDRGKLCQIRGGYVAIRPNFIDSKPILETATEFQKRAYVANVIRHEVGHMMVFGHVNGTGEGKQLMAEGFPDDLSSDVWNKFLTFDADESRMLDCYNPNSGKGDLCD